jgi:pSer/pThr/pTyr-binding forkhead associated (FHA) protein
MDEREITRVHFFTVDPGDRAVSLTESFKTRPVFVIGSDARAQLRLDGVAPSHAVVHQRESEFWIGPRFPKLDLRLNGRLIGQPARLQPGDTVQIGAHSLHFEQKEREIRRTPASLAPVTVTPAFASAVVTPAIGASLTLPDQGAEIYFPRREEESASSFTALVVGLITLLAIVSLVGFGLFSNEIGNAVSLGNGRVLPASFAYNDGNVTFLMFDADW